MSNKSLFSLIVCFYCTISIIRAISLKSLHNNTVAELYSYPEQIHLSYGTSPDQIIVTWVTLDFVNDSVVEYGVHDFKSAATGISEIFVDEGPDRRQINIHRVILSNLLPNKVYSKYFVLGISEIKKYLIRYYI